MTVPGGAATRQFLHGHVPEAVAASRLVAQLPASQKINLAIGLPLRNQDELNTLLKDLFDPASPNFHHYLSSEEFAERFGPTEADYEALGAYFRSNGFSVTGTHPNRMILDVSAAVADVDRTLHVNMMTWRHPTRGEFFAPDREPSIDAGVTILDITGLDNFVVAHPMNLKSRALDPGQPLARSFTTGSGPGGLFNGTDFRNAYAPSVTLNGSGQSIGLFELDGFFAKDVAANFQEAGLAPVPVKTVLLDGFSGSPGSANVEVTLDIMMASYMAPSATNIIVYEGTNWNDVLNRMATDNLASQLSSSWGFSPTNATTEQIFSEMITQGQSLFQASGDDAAYRGAIMPPSDDPNVTVVGGTSLTTAGAGGPWQSEVAWSDSGGGVSTTWPIPSYQRSVNMAAVGGSSTMRNIPDVALLADIQIFLICNNGYGYEIGGTSAAAPLWAGFLALANQQAASNGKSRIGFLNPTIYSLAAGSSYGADLHDITSGNNGFNTFPGYDLVTGWGSPQGQPLINSLTSVSSAPDFGLSSSAATLSIGAGASGTSTITISAQNGFAGNVNLAASGLPAGVTASFSPSTGTTTSILTLTAGSSAAASTSTITITGTSGNLSSTARLQLTVTVVPSFNIAASPTSVSLAAGGTSTTSAITITPLNGFNSTVSLSASGLPAGVTASFTTPSVKKANSTTSSTLTLAASSSAKPGSYTFTVTGTSGSITSTANITLTVTAAPTFTLSAAPANLTVVRGSSAPSTITITPQNGFTGTVTLAASGQPTGVTASFSTTNVKKVKVNDSTAGTLTLTANGSATLGTFTVTVTGTSASLRTTATISLTVAAAPSFTFTATPASLSVTQGTTGSSALTVTPLNGFSGNITYTAAGLPSGVTASFSATTTNTPATLTLMAAGTATVGKSTVTITGTSGSISSKTTIALTIAPQPNFTLAATPATMSVSPGSTSSGNIAITSLYSFSGAVAFSASGLPTGVTATFGAAANGKSAVTFTAASSAVAKTAIVTITGTSGNLTNKCTINLTVTQPPSFTLAAAPSALSVTAGASGTSTVAIVSENGFAGTVVFSASGLPTGVTATFGAVSGGKSIATISAASAAAAGTSSITITGTSGALSSHVAIALTVRAAPTFSLAVSPTALSVQPGALGTSALTITPQNGFTGTVALSISGLPSGVVASFTGGSKPAIQLAVTAAASPALSTITVTGTSGSLTKTATVALTVAGSTGGSALVNMTPLYNVAGIVTDSTSFSGGGLDGGGRAYSANLLGAVQSANGRAFSFGPANGPDAVTSATVALPAGQYSSIALLATAVNGNQTNQTFKVTYTDGSSSTFTQNLSDWCTPQSYPGESKALAMTYRDNSTATRDTRAIALYGYTFNLAAGKTAQSITLPSNRNVVVLAISLGTATSSSR